MEEDGSARDWACLPDLALHSILNRLIDLPDFFAFNGVCCSWRSVSKSLAGRRRRGYMISRPPLLLRPVVERPVVENIRRPYPTKQFKYQFRRPYPTTCDTCFYYKLSPKVIYNMCIGYSHGYLILKDYNERRYRPLLVDVFTGKEIRLPALPPECCNVYYGVLTAPPSSPDCMLLLFDSCAYLWCRLGDVEWSHQRHGYGVTSIRSVLVFKGQIYAVNHRCELFIIDFIPNLKLKQLEFEDFDLEKWNAKARLSEFNGPQLVEFDGELLVLLILDPWGQVSYKDIEIYRLDFSRLSLMEVHSLGGCSLFVDCVGRTPVVCINPATWGCRKNCIYLAGWSPSYECCSLDGKLIDKIPYASSNSDHPLQIWDSGVWVFPCLIY